MGLLELRTLKSKKLFERELKQTGPTLFSKQVSSKTHTASISNRTDDFSYFWVLRYADREGVKVGDRFKTFRTRLNLESKVTDFLTIGLNSSFGTKDKGALSADVGQRTNNSPFTTNEIDDPDSPCRMYPLATILKSVLR